MARNVLFQPIQTDQATSTGTADVKTLTPPSGAHGCWVQVSTNACYMAFTSGETPSSSEGLPIVKDTAPIYFPIASALKFASQAAGNSVVNVLWVG